MRLVYFGSVISMHMFLHSVFTDCFDDITTVYIFRDWRLHTANHEKY